MNPGDYTCEETHVPISNTTVKLIGPMIVLTGAKVGHRREHFIKPDLRIRLFLCAVWALSSLEAGTAGRPVSANVMTWQQFDSFLTEPVIGVGLGSVAFVSSSCLFIL